MNEQKISYVGKQVFVGIDVHRHSYTISCICEGEVVHRGKFPSDGDLVIRFLKSRFSGAELLTAYEAGFSGFVLHRELEAAGIRNIVVNASSVEIASRDRVKTDRRDSLKLALQLSTGRLRGIAVPSEAQELHRVLSRSRAQFVKLRTKVRNQLRMRLHQFGYLPKELRWELTQKKAQALSESIREAELGFVVAEYLALWTSMEERIAAFDGALAKQAAEDELERIYRSASGIGRVSARVLANELGDLRRFPNERALFSFTGLTPSEYSSGEKRYLGHISRQGSARVRAVLIECAWTAIKRDEKLREDFLRISTRAGRKRAIVAVARKLIGRIRAAFDTGEYLPGHRIAA